jgi:glutathione synthase/RimK-type ligase-like ATP-grasp enzyme
MRMFILTARRVPDVPSPLLVEVSDRLRALGHEVEHGTPEQMLVDAVGLTPGHDLYLLKSHTELALSVTAALAAQGARILNPYHACAAAQDKLLANRRLHAAGVPVPRTFVAADYDLIGECLDGTPKVVKPLRGHRGEGVEVVGSRAALVGRRQPPGPLIVQDLIDGPGEDLKVYVVGERVWAVRKPFSATSFSVAGRPVPVTREIRDIALRAAAATGLGLLGLDIIEGVDGPVVVDANYFPGYKGCVGVAAPMAAYVHDYAKGAVDLVLPPMLPSADPAVIGGERESVA